MIVCPSCGNEMSEEIIDKTKKCYFCQNPDFSESAYSLLNYQYKKINCLSCGKLMKSDDGSHYNPTFFFFSKKLNINPYEFVHLCDECDNNIKPTRIKIKKVLSRIKASYGKSAVENRKGT